MEEISVFFAVDAEQYLISGFPQEAIDLCQRGLEAYPDYSAAYTVLARAYKALGEDDKAAEILDSAAEKFSDKRLFEPAKKNLDFVPTFLNNAPTNEAVTGISDVDQQEMSDEQVGAFIQLEPETAGCYDPAQNVSFESILDEAIAQTETEDSFLSNAGTDDSDSIDLSSMLDSIETDEIDPETIDDSDLDAAFAAEQSVVMEIDLGEGGSEIEDYQETQEDALSDQPETESTELPTDFDSSLAEGMAEQRSINPEALEYIDQALAFNPDNVTYDQSEQIETESNVESLDLQDDGSLPSLIEGEPDLVAAAEIDGESDLVAASEVEADTELVIEEEIEVEQDIIVQEEIEAELDNIVDEEIEVNAAVSEMPINSADEMPDLVTDVLASADGTEGRTLTEEETHEAEVRSEGNFILRAVNLAQGEEDDSRELRAGNLALIPGLDFSPLKSGTRKQTHRPIGQDLDFPPFDIELEEAEEPAAYAAMPERTDTDGAERSAGGFDFSELAAQLEAVSIPKPRAAVAEVNDDAHVSGFASETMAFIYEQQGAWEAALDSYRKLLAAKPERADFYIGRIESIEGNIKLRGIDR